MSTIALEEYPRTGAAAPASAGLAPAAEPRKHPLRRTHIQLLCLAGVMAMVGMGAGYEEYVHDRLFAKRFGEVEPGLLYRSGQIHPDLIQSVLAEHHVAVVIDLTGQVPGSPAQAAELRAIEALHIEQHRIPMPGTGKGDAEALKQAMTLLHESYQAGQPALVHCSAGSNRTGGVVALWRVLVDRVPTEEAVREMIDYDFSPRDKHGLLPYLNRHMREVAEHLVAIGAIDAVPDPLPVLTMHNG